MPTTPPQDFADQIAEDLNGLFATKRFDAQYLVRLWPALSRYPESRVRTAIRDHARQFPDAVKPNWGAIIKSLARTHGATATEDRNDFSFLIKCIRSANGQFGDRSDEELFGMHIDRIARSRMRTRTREEFLDLKGREVVRWLNYHRRNCIRPPYWLESLKPHGAALIPEGETEHETCRREREEFFTWWDQLPEQEQATLIADARERFSHWTLDLGSTVESSMILRCAIKEVAER